MKTTRRVRDEHRRRESSADLGTRQIVRVNPKTGRVVGRLGLRGLPVRLAVGFGSLWVRDDSGRVLRIKPQR